MNILAKLYKMLFGEETLHQVIPLSHVTSFVVLAAMGIMAPLLLGIEGREIRRCEWPEFLWDIIFSIDPDIKKFDVRGYRLAVVRRDERFDVRVYKKQGGLRWS